LYLEELARFACRVRLADLPEPVLPSLAEPYGLLVAGIGGTGIVTVNQVLGTAAVRDGLAVHGVDQTGLSQKAGPVTSHLRLAPDPAALGPANRVGVGTVDCYLAFDALVGGDPKFLSYAAPDRTVAVVSTSAVPTGSMVRDASVAAPDQGGLVARISDVSRHVVALDAQAAALELFGDAMPANLLLVGAAYQAGALPLSAAAIEWAIELNGVAVAVNVAAFLISLMVPAITLMFGLSPADIFGRLHIWTPITYMFLHAGVFHILFNMLALWMFGVELERTWGSRYFLKYYFVCGVGAAMTTVLLSFVPGTFGQQLYYSLTIGASGAVYGVLLAYAMYFPNRPIYMYFVFPIPAKYFVAIIGAISLLSSMGGPGGGIAHTTHLGGLLAGYLYLKGGRVHLLSEIKYRYLKWRINRMRRKFDVYSGGRTQKDVDRRFH